MAHEAIPQQSGDINDLLEADDEVFLEKFPGLKGVIGKVPNVSEVGSDESDESADEEVADEEVEDAIDEEEATALEETGEVEDDDEAEVVEEKPVASEKKPEPAKLGDFQVFDDEGELEAESLSNVKVTFKADGKVRENVPFDKVVRLAKMGFHNEGLLKEVDEAREVAPRYEAQLQSKTEQIEEIAKFARRLLTDDEYLVKQREEYEKGTSSESELQRTKAELATLKSQKELEKFATEANAFVLGLDGDLESLQKEYGAHVTEDEVRGRLDRLTRPLLRQGVVPREHWSTVERLIKTDLKNWMAGLHEERSEKETTVKKEADKTVKEAKDRVRKTKRAFARATKPLATPSSQSSSATSGAKKKAPSTSDEAESNIIRRIVGQVRGG